MRCRFCGSTMIHPDTKHKTFSGGKAVAGAVTFGVVGAAAGFIGKDQKGYSCGHCGAFMDAPMDFSTELSINSAIRSAEAGRDVGVFDYYVKQYPGISANIPAKSSSQSEVKYIQMSEESVKELAVSKESDSKIKRVFRNNFWQPNCPIFIDTLVIKTVNGRDFLSMKGHNQSDKAIRSVYFKANILDDTGDLIGEITNAYQGLELASGAELPLDMEFDLNTNLAYKVDLRLDKIALSDDSVWRYSEAEEEYPIEPQMELTEISFPRFKYVKTSLKDYCVLDENAPLFMPIKSEKIWQCICGQPVADGKECPKCKMTFEKAEELLSQKRLAEMQQEAVKKIAANRAKATMEFYEQAKNAGFESRYLEAEKLFKEYTIDSLKKAKDIYDELGEYKDSIEKSKLCAEKIPVFEARLAKEKEDLEQHKREEEERDRVAAERRAIEAHKSKIKRIIMAIVAVVAIIALVYVVKVIVPKNKLIKAEKNYAQATEALAAREYDRAIDLFIGLGDYSDSAEMIQKARSEKVQDLVNQGMYDDALDNMLVYGFSEEEIADVLFLKEVKQLKEANVGDDVTFGHLEKHAKKYKNNKVYGDLEDYEHWLVLEKDGSRLLLFNQFHVAKAPAELKDGYYGEPNWENSTIREFLTKKAIGEFISPKESEIIVYTEVEEGVYDQLFLLSEDEALKYGLENHGSDFDDKWWLRGSYDAVYNAYGKIKERLGKAFPLDDDSVCNIGEYHWIVPAMWVDTSLVNMP